MNSKTPKPRLVTKHSLVARLLRPKEADLTELTKPEKTQAPKLVRKILWAAPDGITCVVAGPFPRSFKRSMTRDAVSKAALFDAWDIAPRDETTRDDQYALVFLYSVTEEPEENDFGPVMP